MQNMVLLAAGSGITAFLGFLTVLLCVALLIGPAFLLHFGATYYFRPAASADSGKGFRTPSAKGSTKAWKYAQKMAGMIWGGLGALLLVAMLIVCLTFIGKNQAQMASVAATCLAIQVVLVAIATAVIHLLVYRAFGKNKKRKQ